MAPPRAQTPSPRSTPLLSRLPSRRADRRRGAASTSRTGARPGKAVVEFAVVAPLLFLLVFGIIEFGRIMMVQEILTNAAREGARKASLPGVTKNDVATTIDSYMKKSGITNYATPDLPDPAAVKGGDPVGVTVQVDFANVSYLPGFGGSQGWMRDLLGGQSTDADDKPIKLGANVQMRKEEY